MHNKLDELAILRKKMGELKLAHDAAIDELLPMDIKNMIAELDEQLRMRMEELTMLASALEESIKQEVMTTHNSVKGAHLHAVYYKGRTNWDAKGLESYAKVHPQILAYKSVSDPYVVIRAVMIKA